MNEFTLINYFQKKFPSRHESVIKGIGDDAACLRIPSNQDVLVSTDSLICGVHFLPEWSPYDIASKAVLVNVSDMVAMGANPLWMTLALTLPEIQTAWLEAFTEGLKDRLKEFNMDLIGGNTSKGPLSITITIMGLAPHGQALYRSGAKPEDAILVSGELGAAALAIKTMHYTNVSDTDRAILMNQLLHPKSHVGFIPILRQYASSCIDISDGLSADLNHICDASGLGACIIQDNVPIHPLLNTYCNQEAFDLALTGGDDYELCFTVPISQLDALMKKGKFYHIGFMEKKRGLRLQKSDGTIKELRPQGFQHFL